MKTRTEKLQNGVNCAEVCTIIHDGKEFTSGGATVYEVDGKLRGVLYVDSSSVSPWEGPGNVRPINRTPYLQNWEGSIKIPCTIGSTWKSSFVDYHGRRQVNRSFYFQIHGRKCRGVQYNLNWQEIVRFKEL